MKKIILILVAAGLLAWFLFPKKNVAPNPEKISPDVAIANALATATPAANAAIDSAFAKMPTANEKVLPNATATTLPRAGKPHAPEITNMAPLTVLENARTAIHNYGQRFEGNPVGNNAEITRALAGENPKQINFISADAGLRLNEQGEMLDAFGTPFFFHQMSKTEMEIHSAGPDKVMWTDDDLMTR